MKKEAGNFRRKKLILFLIRLLQERPPWPGFRIVAWTLQKDHLHMLAEARSQEDLSRTMKGLLSQLGRGWNAILQRKGPLFQGRYFVRVVRDEGEAKKLLNYVLKNHIRHGLAPAGVFDPFSSTFWQDVWLEREAWDEERRRRGFFGKPAPIAVPFTQVFRKALVPGAVTINGKPMGYRRDLLTPVVLGLEEGVEGPGGIAP